MEKLQVAEHFISINGEGRRAGQLAMFIRFTGCNLDCRYCDTKWANIPDAPYEAYTAQEIMKLIRDSGVRNVTLTGGEPLLQKGLPVLLEMLRAAPELQIEIETNGSVDIVSFLPEKADGAGKGIEKDNVTFTIDYKTPVSGMEDRMCSSNYQNLRRSDTVKFVVGSRDDMMKAKEIVESYHLVERGCAIYFSPCFGSIEPAEIVDFLVEQHMNDVTLQLQLHKYIWDPDKRGV